MTESEIRKIVKDVLRDELKSLNKKLDSIKDDVTNLKKSYVDEDGVRKIVRKMIVNQHKWMWEKSSTYINKL